MNKIKIQLRFKLNFLLLIAVLVFHQTNCFSQPNDVIIITGEGLREVEPAFRIKESPALNDTNILAKITEYPRLILQHESKAIANAIKPGKLKASRRNSKLYNGYAKLGIGSQLMPIAEIQYGSSRDKEHLFGAYAKHLSSFSKIRDYAPAQFDRTRAGLFGSILKRKFTLSGGLHYKTHGFHYYGWPNSGDTIQSIDIAQRYQNIALTSKFASHKKDSANLNYSIALNYNHFNTKKPLEDSLFAWRAKENNVFFNSRFWYKHGKELFSTDLNVQYNGFIYGMPDSSISSIDTGYILNNTIISLSPNIVTQFMNNRFRIEVGLNLALDIHNKTKFYVFPKAEVKYSLFNDIFIPYAGITGGIKQQTLNQLSQINEFVVPQVHLRNEKNPFSFYAGIKGVVSKRMSFNSSFTFSSINDKLFFVLDTNNLQPSKFNLAYDSLKVSKIEGSISYQISEKLKADAIGRFYSYELKNNSYAWYMPQFEFITRASYNLYKKFIFNVDLTVETGRKMLLINEEEGSFIENDQIIKDLGALFDMNLGVEYRYNKRISAFVQFNNTAAQRYLKWHNYPVQGFQLMGGVTARF